ncbi:hypothetical protein BpOF4_18985 [Alkalihalophilus pseudofirmus OF4]|uniref:SipL SPOCS domain-containing protein n=1 Tax=Alkalihalophilus pseudofirmus (strain ATCC BAA-2126 / JCM 17055 / OF4) TaxID=398511 RepID=D3FSX1_ALKPO|nr:MULTISPECIES: hypothetical protein [Alkalihalophilus]ADC51836.1 hypothetical protein BpOF4_18985 [Alkalihalophilus pseudofirmus OF4]MED1599727.1 hypothetical protein [Alkalihalophilus marmarensis]
MDFHCNQHNHLGDFCCGKEKYHKPAQPSIECLKVNSVICTKSVQKVAELRVPTVELGIGDDIDLALISFSNVTANPNGIVMRGTLIDGKVVNSGYVPVTANINIAGVALPIEVSLNLPFQEETECPGACVGDDLQETVPVIEAVLEPVITPGITVAGAVSLATITFKVIIRTQITVSREKLVQAGVTVLGDINPDRCTTLQPTLPTSRTVTFYNGNNG